MAAFWQDWQLWEKLVFLLACGIVTTIGAGVVKVVLTRKRLQSLRGRVEVDEIEYDDNCKHPQSVVSHAKLEVTDTRDGPRAEDTTATEQGTTQQTCERLQRIDAYGLPHDSTERSRLTHFRKDNPAELPSATVFADTADDLGGHWRDRTLDGHYSLFMLQHPDYVNAMNEIEAEYQASARIDNLEAQPRTAEIDTAIHSSRPEGSHGVKQESPARRQELICRQASELSIFDRQRHLQAAETGQIPRRMRHYSS